MRSAWSIVIAGGRSRSRCGQQHIETFLDLRFGQRIDAGGGFVQDDDRGVLDQDPGQRNELPLAHRKATARPRRHRYCSPFGSTSTQSPGRPTARGRLDLLVGRVRARDSGCCRRRCRRTGTAIWGTMPSWRRYSAGRSRGCPCRRSGSGRPGTRRSGRSACRGSTCPRRCGRRTRPSRRPGCQIEVVEDRLSPVGVRRRGRGTRSARAAAGSIVGGLDDPRLGVDQREDPLAAARPCWNWLQNEAMLVSGNQNERPLWKKRNQSPALISAVDHVGSAEVETSARAQPRRRRKRSGKIAEKRSPSGEE